MTAEQRIKRDLAALKRDKKKELIEFRNYIFNHAKVPMTNSDGKIIRFSNGKNKGNIRWRNVKGLDEFKSEFRIISKDELQSLRNRANENVINTNNGSGSNNNQQPKPPKFDN